MATLKDSALAYTPKQTKNIADLPQVPTDLELKQAESLDTEGKPFSYKYRELNGEHFRVPGSVIGQLKDLLTENVNLKTVKIKKTGTGMTTRYTVIPLG